MSETKAADHRAARAQGSARPRASRTSRAFPRVTSGDIRPGPPLRRLETWLPSSLLHLSNLPFTKVMLGIDGACKTNPTAVVGPACKVPSARVLQSYPRALSPPICSITVWQRGPRSWIQSPSAVSATMFSSTPLLRHSSCRQPVLLSSPWYALRTVCSSFTHGREASRNQILRDGSGGSALRA